jgi:hypothetical protein
MNGKCNKCGYVGEMHQVGRTFPEDLFIIIQCPKCCFIYDFIVIKESMKKQEGE